MTEADLTGEFEPPVVEWLGPWRCESADRYARRCRHLGSAWDAVLYRFTNTADGTEHWRKAAVLVDERNA